MLLPALVGCNANKEEPTTESPTTSAPSAESTTEEITTEAENTVTVTYESQFVSFIAYNKESVGMYEMTGNTTCGGKFTVPEGYLEQINIRMGTIGDIDIKLYKWNTDYDTTIASEPIAQKQVRKAELDPWYATANSCNVELKFNKDEIGAGEYLYVVSAPKNCENRAGVFFGTGWSNKLPEKYSYYAEYNIVSYHNGKKTVSGAVQASYVYAKPVEKTGTVEQPFTPQKDPAGTAKVIILAGQSNAVGRSMCDLLKEKVTAEKFAEYTNGYSNVQIMYNNVNGGPMSDTFINTQLGLGGSPEQFGPELGLAEYLSENYPDEKFYIIKFAMSGSTLDTQWYNAEKNEVGMLLGGLTEFVSLGLKNLEDQGLTPKIVGMVWNQGESDAMLIPTSSRYYENLEGLVKYVRTTFSDYASVNGIAFIDATIRESIWTAYRYINIQKFAYAATSPINFCIDVWDYDEINTLYENNDLAHYDSMGTLKLGHLYGAELAKLLA